jgi:hypothetical protein
MDLRLITMILIFRDLFTVPSDKSWVDAGG